MTLRAETAQPITYNKSMERSKNDQIKLYNAKQERVPAIKRFVSYL